MKFFRYLILILFVRRMSDNELSIFAYALFLLEFAIRPIIDRIKPHTVFRRRNGMYFVKNARHCSIVHSRNEKILISSRMGEYCGTQSAGLIRPGCNRPFTSHDTVARFYAETA